MKDNREIDDGEGLVFYYNREKRLEHAPESVQRAYREGYTPNKGFIKGLTANAGLKSILFVIIGLMILILFLTVFGDTTPTLSVDGSTIRLRAFLYEESVYVSLILDQRRELLPEPMPVTAHVVGLSAEGAVITEKELAGVYTGKELVLRGIIRDYEIARVSAVVRYGNNEGSITIAVDRE